MFTFIFITLCPPFAHALLTWKGRAKSSHSDTHNLSADSSPRHPAKPRRPHSVGPFGRHPVAATGSAASVAGGSSSGGGASSAGGYSGWTGLTSMSSDRLPNYAAHTVSSKIRSGRSRQRGAWGGKDDVDDSSVQPVCSRFRKFSSPPLSPLIPVSLSVRLALKSHHDLTLA